LDSSENSTLSNLELSSVFVRQASSASADLSGDSGSKNKIGSSAHVIQGFLRNTEIGAGFLLI